MRTFYIFQINDEFTTLTKEQPYNLYKTMEEIYFLQEKDPHIAYDMFEKIVNPFNKKEINLKIFDIYRHNENYTKFNNIHMLNNYYTDEQSKLIIKNSHLLLNSSSTTPSFLKELRFLNNLFICDFKNKDYFWLDQLIV